MLNYQRVNGWFKTKGWPTPVIPEAFDFWIFWCTCADANIPHEARLRPSGRCRRPMAPLFPVVGILSCQRGSSELIIKISLLSNNASRTFQRCIFFFELQLWKKTGGSLLHHLEQTSTISYNKVIMNVLHHPFLHHLEAESTALQCNLPRIATAVLLPWAPTVAKTWKPKEFSDRRENYGLPHKTVKCPVSFYIYSYILYI